MPFNTKMNVSCDRNGLSGGWGRLLLLPGTMCAAVSFLGHCTVRLNNFTEIPQSGCTSITTSHEDSCHVTVARRNCFSTARSLLEWPAAINDQFQSRRFRTGLMPEVWCPEEHCSASLEHSGIDCNVRCNIKTEGWTSGSTLFFTATSTLFSTWWWTGYNLEMKWRTICEACNWVARLVCWR